MTSNSTFRKLRSWMASGPITSWQIDGEKVEIVAVLIKSLDSSEIMSYFLPICNGLLTVILASNSTIQLNDPQTVDLRPVALASPVNLLDVQLPPAPSESCYIRHVSC